MHLPRKLLSLAPALAFLVACTDPSAPTADLAGNWTTGMVPSGAYTELSLSTVGNVVNGSGSAYGLMSALVNTYTVSGHVQLGTFTLTLVPPTGAAATFTGRAYGDSVVGTWSAGAQSFQRKFFRITW